MKRLINIIIVTTFIFTGITGQNKINLSSGIGLNNFSNFSKHTNIKYLSAVSLNIGFSNEATISKTKSFNIGLHFSYKPIKEKMYIDSLLVINENSSYYEYYDDGYRISKTNNFYVKIPMFLSFRRNKNLGVNIGIYNNFLINKKFEEQSFYNMSLLSGINYKINSKYSLFINFYADILPYIKNDRTLFTSFPHNSYNYGAMLSLSYKIFENEK